MKLLNHAGLVSGLLLVINVNAAIIDINATVLPNNTDLNLSAGDYVVNSIGTADGGLYDAWNAWGSVLNCDANGANCYTGYIHSYGFETAELGAITIGDISARFADPLDALANASPFYFSLASDAVVSFYINDNVGDNLGGVSLALTQVSAVPVPAAVWLFGSGLLGLFGFAKKKSAKNI